MKVENKAVRHNFIRLHEKLAYLNKDLNAELIKLNSRPINGADALLKNIQKLQVKINETNNEYLKAISNAISYSVH